VCYNYEEFKNFRKMKLLELCKVDKNISTSDFCYVYDPTVLRGYSNPKGWLWGRWKERADIENILMTLIICHNGFHVRLSSLLYEIRNKVIKWET
jgi:hypothetical protein